MTEIVLSNFEEKFNELKASLKEAIFVAIDTEFSGLRSNKENPSLFDSNGERYSKLKNHVESYIIIQFGLAVFHYDKLTNSYSADVFNIYLFPRSFGTVDRGFKFQASSVEFLCRYNYDFNKMTYEGVSYVQTHEEAQLRADLASGVLLQKLHAKCESDIQDLRTGICSEVGKWLATAGEGETLVVHFPKLLLPFLLHYELRISFPNIWSENVAGEALKIRVVKVSSKTRAQLESDKGDKEEAEKALLHLLGFTRVISLLSDLTVPIVGHNVLLDLMMSYQQFIAPLPETYEEFKFKFQGVFGKIYDTKFLGHEIKRKFQSDALWESALPNVYNFLKSKRCDAVAPDPPVIRTDAYPASDNSQPKSIEKDVTKNPVSCNGIDTASLKKSNEAVNDITDILAGINGMGDGFIKKESNLDFSMGLSHDGNSEQEEHFHEAGWDAFCAGYVFLKLAHVDARQKQLRDLTDNSVGKVVANVPKKEQTAVIKNAEHKEKAAGNGKSQNENKEIILPPLSWTDLHESVKPYVNRVHITMGQISHMNLGGNDDTSRRPRCLHIQARGKQELNISMIQDMFAQYASVDIRPYSRHRALVAVTTVACVRDLLRGFKNHPLIKVEVYSPLKHSRALRAALGAGSVALISAGIALIVLGFQGRLN